jgi:putative nucleotidyltransferase with HDIG domain
VVNGKEAASVSILEVYSAKTAYEQLFSDPKLAPQRNILKRCNLNDYIVPNLIYDRERSESSRDELLSGIALASGLVQKGQKIVGRGEIVTEKTYRIVESFKQENERRNEDVTQNQISLTGQILYVTIIMICFTIYLSLYRIDYFDKPRSIMMLYALIIIFTVATALFMRNTFIHVYILPYAMVPIFIRVFMDSRTAFMTHFTMVLICAVMLQHPFEFIAVETIAGLVAISSLRELSQRSQLFKTALIVTAIAMSVNLACDWMRADALAQIDYSAYNYLAVNGVALLFAYPLLYLIEKAFGFTSDITLIELSNTNNELLRKMSEVAPGTFNHSIQVANLAGEIANKIGAKAQLVRTGALYHDIGKLSNPIYFTENQSGIDPHEMLTDIESAQIIISHVTEGLKMADKYNLPQVIREFISTHHGQGKAKFFYIRYNNEHPDEPVDDLLFTYPGPNPFTREHACLMMADGVEAASRSLPDYTEQSIRQLVERIIDSQVADGYFRECPVTFRDIQYAKTVLIEKLKTIYHTRISYPDEKK